MKKSIRTPYSGRSSKATSSTLCQKCLKKGHYSYECKAATQERPYVSRPSRTQQLLNPKLIPKLSNEVPHDLLRKKGIADEQLAKFDEERGRKRETHSREYHKGSNLKRTRSISSSSVSVSTISTRSSLSPEPLPVKAPKSQTSNDRSRLKESSSNTRRRSTTRTKMTTHQQSSHSVQKKRNREPSSDTTSPTPIEYRTSDRKSSRRRNQSIGSSPRDKMPRRKSPFKSQNPSNLEICGDSKGALASTNINSKEDKVKSPKREKSLSPFSKRIELTKAMNMSR